jgi:predicted dehydrogenase
MNRSLSKLRVGIVGCGKIADAHVEQVRATGMAEVVAVCDRELLMARQLALRFDVATTYDDLAAMLACEHLDVLHIATPPDSHLALARQAFAAGTHVFLEKPFALTAFQTREIHELARAAGRRVTVNYLYCFERPFLELMQRVRAGSLGDIIHIDTAFGYDLSGDYGLAVLADPNHWVHRLPGKLFHNVLDHVLCKVAPLLPDQPLSATCHAFRMRPAVGNSTVDDLPDELRFTLSCGNVTVSACISSHARPVTHTLRVLGSRDSVLLDFGARTITQLARQRYPASVGRLFPAVDQAGAFARQALTNVIGFWRYEYHFFQGMRRLLSAFYESIRSGGADALNERDVLVTCQAIDTVIAGMASSRLAPARSECLSV